MTRSITSIVGACAAFVAVLPACNTSPKTEQERRELTTDAGAALDRFRQSDSTLQAEMDRAAGYAIIPEVKKGGVGVGGAYGRGEVYEHGRQIGFCDMSQGTVGLQLGAQTYSELILFRTDHALQEFKGGGFAFSANASAVAIKSGSGAAAPYRDDVAVFIHTRDGLMAEASIGGQKFRFEPIADSAPRN